MLAPVAGAASGGECTEVAAACEHGRGGDRVIGGGIHNDETGAGDRLRVAHHIVQGRASALFGTAKGFLQHVGDAAGIVARGDLAVDLAVPALAVVHPPVHHVDQLLGDFRGARPAGESAFHAQKLRRLRQHCGAAVFDE